MSTPTSTSDEDPRPQPSTMAQEDGKEHSTGVGGDSVVAGNPSQDAQEDCGQSAISQSQPPAEPPVDRGNQTVVQKGDRTLDSLGQPTPGSQVGCYHVIRELGRGGMGVVYEAVDSSLHRRVAVKVLVDEHASNHLARERFLREARAAAALKSDHVVTIYQVVEDARLPFLAMEYLEGSTLDDWLKSRPGPATLPEILWIAQHVLTGLAAAHSKGLIHRDIKPANLWVEKDTGRVKLLDFGLARPMVAADGLTNPGAMVGTAGYMAPEQADGLEVDIRADLFSFGAVLYRVATGKPAFQGKTLSALLKSVALHYPSPPRALNPAVPPQLSSLILKLLSKTAPLRPPSAQAVLTELQGIGLLDSPGTARQPSSQLQGVKDTTRRGAESVEMPLLPVRRTRGLRLLFVLLGLATLVVGTLALWGRDRLRQSERSPVDHSKDVVNEPPIGDQPKVRSDSASTGDRKPEILAASKKKIDANDPGLSEQEKLAALAFLGKLLTDEHGLSDQEKRIASVLLQKLINDQIKSTTYQSSTYDQGNISNATNQSMTRTKLNTDHLSKLLGHSATALNHPNQMAIAGIIDLERGIIQKGNVKSELIKREKTAIGLVDQSGDRLAPLLYLGMIFFRQADLDLNIQTQIALYRRSADAFSKAAQAANQPDEKALLPLLHYNAAIVNLRIANYIIDRAAPSEVRKQLQIAFSESEKLLALVPDDPHALDVKGCILEDQAWLPAEYSESQRKQFYRNAVTALSKATKDETESGVIRFEALLHLGRCRYKWANQFPDPDPDHPRETKQQLLADAVANLDEVVQRKDQSDQPPEALYWLAMIELTRAGLTWAGTATKSFPDDLLLVTKLDDSSLNKARDHLVELQKLSKSANKLSKSWYEQEGADWLACLICYQARTEDKGGVESPRHREALGALDRLAESDPLTAALRRTQYLYGQLETSADQRAKAADIKVLWSDFEKSRPDPKLTATSPDGERKLLTLYLLRYRATAIEITQQLQTGENPEKPFDRVLELIKRGGMEKANIAIQLEATAYLLASRAVKAGTDEAKIATLAARAFLKASELDESIGYLSKFSWRLITAAQWREYTADSIKKVSPDDAEKLYAQGEIILANAKDEKEKKLRDDLKLKRIKLIKSK